MGKKTKTKKGKGAEKTLQKTQRKLDKKLAKLEKESGDITIEKLLEEHRGKQKQLTEVLITPSPPPSPRSHFSLTAIPDNGELLLFGGEYFDGSKITIYSDLFAFDCKEQKWSMIQSPNTPPPRSGHQAVFVKTPAVPASLWIFGGEYASPSQVRFYHYKDLWCLRTRTRKWEQIQVDGSAGPCARSGHRMISWKNSLVLFGGFNDTGSQTIYYNDLWSFDIPSSNWTMIQMTGDVPTTRSGCVLLPGSDMKTVYIFGGYRKERVGRDVERGNALSDHYRVCFEKNLSSAHASSLRISGVRPKPARSGLSYTLHSSNVALIFGGVHDIESEDGENVVGYFHNDCFKLELDKGRWHPFNYLTSKDASDSAEHGKSVGSSQSSTAAHQLANGTSSSTDQAFSSLCQISDGDHAADSLTVESQSSLPPPRASAALVLLGSTLYLYGGVFEVGDRKITLDDFYCLDVNKPVAWQCLYSGTQNEQEWLGSDLDDDDDEEEEEGASSDDLAEGMEVDDEDDSDSDEDDELVADAPVPSKMETFTSYWERTTDFWCGLVSQGLENSSEQPGPSKPDSSTIIVAKRLAEDFHKTNSGC